MGVEWSNICTVQSEYTLVYTYWTLACPGLAVSLVSHSHPPGTLSLTSAGHMKMLNTDIKICIHTLCAFTNSTCSGRITVVI